MTSPVVISPSHHHHHNIIPHSSSQSTENEAGTSGVARDEVIIVDSSDDVREYLCVGGRGRVGRGMQNNIGGFLHCILKILCTIPSGG